MARTDAKPAGYTAVDKSGQYAELVAFYGLNEGAGNTVTNYVNGSGTATFSNAVWGTDSVGPYIDTASGSSGTTSETVGTFGISGSADRTIFVRFYATGDTEGSIFGEGTRGMFGLGRDNTIMVGDVNEVWYAAYGMGSGTNVVSTAALVLSGSTVTLYVNGSDEGTTSTLPNSPTSATFTLGGGRAANFLGRIYECGIVNRAWTAAEVSNWDQNPTAMFSAGTDPNAATGHGTADLTLPLLAPMVAAEGQFLPKAEGEAAITLPLRLPTLAAEGIHRTFDVADLAVPLAGTGLGGPPGSELSTALHGLFDRVSGNQQIQGHTDHRCLFLHNGHDADTVILDLTAPATTGTGITYTLGLGAAPSASPNEPVIADETAAPAGIAFAGSATVTLDPGEYGAVWIKRVRAAGGTTAAASETASIGITARFR